MQISQISDIPLESYPLSDQPKRLPIGINGDPYISIPQYTGETDLLLGSLEDDYPNNPYQVLRSLLKELLPKVATEDIYLADAVFIILSLRIKCVGSEICFTYECPCEEKKKMIGGQNTAPHDLATVTINAKPIDSPEILSYKGVKFEPLRLIDLPGLMATSPHLLGHYLLKSMAVSYLPRMSRKESYAYQDFAVGFHQYWGIENVLGFDCSCGYEWESKIMPGIWEDMIIGTLKSHREHSRTGGAEDYLNQVASFLMVGEMAPFKSLSEVRSLTPKSRAYWVEKLSDTYKEIKNDGKKGI
jgi:hypothetical protein